MYNFSVVLFDNHHIIPDLYFRTLGGSRRKTSFQLQYDLRQISCRSLVCSFSIRWLFVLGISIWGKYATHKETWCKKVKKIKWICFDSIATRRSTMLVAISADERGHHADENVLCPVTVEWAAPSIEMCMWKSLELWYSSWVWKQGALQTLDKMTCELSKITAPIKRCRADIYPLRIAIRTYRETIRWNLPRSFDEVAHRKYNFWNYTSLAVIA